MERCNHFQQPGQVFDFPVKIQTVLQAVSLTAAATYEEKDPQIVAICGSIFICVLARRVKREDDGKLFAVLRHDDRLSGKVHFLINIELHFTIGNFFKVLSAADV
jgi:hypothetical protein